jgi:hypothetical protein
MIIDKELELSDAQAIIADAASSKVINTLAAGRAIDELFLLVAVVTAFVSANSTGTLTLKLQTSDDEDFSSYDDLFTSAEFAVTALTADAVLVKMRLPFGLKQYIRMYYDNGTEEFTAGAINALLVSGVETGF